MFGFFYWLIITLIKKDKEIEILQFQITFVVLKFMQKQIHYSI